MEPSAMKHRRADDLRCARCGRWPDQPIGVSADWLREPVPLCGGCWQRVEYAARRLGHDADIAAEAQRWPTRGRSAWRRRQP
jgi:hypothetical protein